MRGSGSTSSNLRIGRSIRMKSGPGSRCNHRSARARLKQVLTITAAAALLAFAIQQVAAQSADRRPVLSMKSMKAGAISWWSRSTLTEAQARAAPPGDVRIARNADHLPADAPTESDGNGADRVSQQQHSLPLQSSHLSPAKRKLLLKAQPSMLHSAVINGKVSLACDISPASADDSVALVLWYKDDSLAPIYTIDARKAANLDRAKTSLDETRFGPANAARASFNLRTKPAQLQLEPVRQTDEGEYRCRVDFKRGRTTNTIIALRVVVPPDELRIVNPQRPHLKLEGHVGPFNEGAELVLTCLALGGKPRPQITWRRDYQVIDESQQRVDKEGTSNELRIPALNKSHSLSGFTCQASNSNLTAPLQSTITLDLNLKPEKVNLRQLNNQEALMVGQTATFECVTSGSRPAASIHWLFQGIRHDAPMSVDQQQQSSSRLTLSLQRSFNQQPLTCVAENPRIPQSSALHQSLKLDVQYPPQLSIKLEPIAVATTSIYDKSATSSGNLDAARGDELSSPGGSSASAHLQEGNDIYLTCQLDANPRPLKPILWRFNGRPLQQSGNHQTLVVMNNQSLVLRKVSRNQSGAYTCEASNLQGSNTSRPLELIIRHAPVCATNDLLVLEAAVGQVVPLNCDVVANPARAVHNSWFLARNERNLSDWAQRDAALDEQIDESSSRLRYRIRDDSSFGLFKCKAKNEIGLQQRACLFQVARAGMPTLRHTCHLSGSTATSLQVNCQPNEHLKSEEFELLGANSDQVKEEPSGLRGWLDLEAMRQRDPESGVPAATPIRRLAFPPAWLLAELYQSSGSVGDSSGELELSAYVVVGAASQLATIKSIVEENRLLSANPKPVYYVIARPQQPANGTAAPPTAAPPFARPQSTAAAVLREDPALQLASAFTFQVPSLEPTSSYKLLLFGQNLANRTRDWQVIRGETQAQDQTTTVASAAAAAAASSLLNLSTLQPTGRLQVTAASAGSGSAANLLAEGSSVIQKSIVMRSDEPPNQTTNEQLPGSVTSAEFPIDQQQQHSLPAEILSQEVSRGNSLLFSQLHQYRDYALTYAKQRPLLAVPLALTFLLVVLLLVARTSTCLLHLVWTSRQERRNSLQKSDSASVGVVNGNHRPKVANSLQNGERPPKSRSPASSNGGGGGDELDEDSYASSGAGGGRAAVCHSSADRYGEQVAAGFKRPAGSAVYALDDGSLLGHLSQLDSYVDLPKVCPFPAAQGSLDRRQFQQPLYLADANQFIQQQNQNHYHQHLNQQQLVGSIDRRRIPSSFLGNQQQQQLLQRPLLLAELDPTTCAQEVQQLDDIAVGNMSNTCCLQSAAGRSRQRQVAFDLSNQPASKQYLCAAELVSSSPGQQASYELTAKSSDSGGSNSNNTADSGHESPLTGETLTSGQSYLLQQQQQQQQHRSQQHQQQQQRTNCHQLHHLPTSISSLRSASVSPSQLGASNQVQQTGAEQQPGNLVMLMELSPGSQESSTLLQSVDSFSTNSTTGFQQVSAPLVYLAANQGHHHRQQDESTTSADGLRLVRYDTDRDLDNWL